MPGGRWPIIFSELGQIARLVIIRGIGVGATFLMSVLIVRKFGAETNGLFQVGLSYAMIGAAVARLGQEQLALRRVAGFRANEDRVNARTLVRTALAMAIPMGVIVAVCMNLAAWITDDAGGMIFAFAFAVVPLAGLWILTEALRGWQYVSTAIFWQSTIPPALFVVIFALLNALQVLSTQFLPWVFVFCATFALFGASIFWKSIVSLSADDRANLRIKQFRSALKQGRDFWVLAIFTHVAAWIDILILMHFADAYVVGVFQPIVRTGGLIAVAINIATAGLVARLALLYYTSDTFNFARLVRLYWLMIGLGSISTGLVFLIFANEILAVWGPELLPYRDELVSYVCIQVFQSIFIIAPLVGPVIGLERPMIVVQIVNLPLKVISVSAGYAYGDLLGVIVGLGFCTLFSVSWITALFLRELSKKGISLRLLVFG